MALCPHPRPPRSTGCLRSERGLTLTELTLVGLLATLVMLGLTGFYFNAQRLWLDTSTKAMTQREATLLVETIARRVHAAAKAEVTPVDAQHDNLALFDSGNGPLGEFRWGGADDPRIFEWTPMGDSSAVVDSRVLRFKLERDTSLVYVQLLELASADGDTIKLTSRLALLGRGL